MKHNAVLLGAAAVCAAVATLAAFLYLRQQSQAFAPEPTVDIVVAKRDLPAGKRLDVDADLTTLKVPQRFHRLRSLGVPPDLVASLARQPVNRLILEGTPLMYADLAAVTELKLQGDERAISINVGGADALSGLLVPGDWVKVFVTRPEEDEANAAQAPAIGRTPDEQLVSAMLAGLPRQPDRWHTEPVFTESVRVLAVGASLSGNRQQLHEAHISGASRPQYDAVTLAVTEDQARTLLERSGAGSLPMTLILCPPPAEAVAGF